MISVVRDNLKQVGSPGRKFLLFSSLNTVAWQCLVGSVLVLFARFIQMPASLVDLLQSFMPLSMLLVVATTPLVDRFGARALMLRGWLARSLCGALVFLMPWAWAWGGVKAGWALLAAAVLSFCLMRAVSVGGWYPWIHELVPPGKRGVYCSLEQSVYSVVNITLAFVIASILGPHPTLSRFFVTEGLGIAAGVASLLLMMRIPGGFRPAVVRSPWESFAEYGRVFRDHSYRRFVPVASIGFCAIAWMAASYILFLRDALGYSERHIMCLLGAAGIGIVLTIGAWGRFADRHGSGRAMTLTLGGFSLAALSWLVLIPGKPWTPFLVWPLTIATMIFSASFQAAAGQGALSHIPEDSRTVYSNLWLVGTSLAQGGTFILAGQVIDRWSGWGYRSCFLLAGASGLVCAAACRSLLQGGRPLAALWRPLQPLRALRLIVSVTLGAEPTIRDLSQK